MANLTSVKIFPSIGIARLGNSPEYFIGPEIPFPAPPPAPPNGKYKDDQCRIKRQAQRFRLYGFYDDGTVNELTLADGAITWTVHVANAKPMKLEGTIIDPGPRTLAGANDVATFANGTYTYGPATTEVPLGEAHTDDQGRLIVVGGFGSSGSLAGMGLTVFHNLSWYDDVCDGSVNATIEINGTPFKAVDGAWVICPPPHYAPSVQTVTSLYDVIRQEMIDQGKLPGPGQPSFANDIWPILKRAMDAKRVAALVFVPGDHDKVASAIGLGVPDAVRKEIFGKLTPPGVKIPRALFDPNHPNVNPPPYADMPRLCPCDPPPAMPDADLPAQDVPPSLRQFQYLQMLAWSIGNFVDDYPGVVPPLTPDGLTRAALEPCVGAVFYPGIEATITIRSSPYTEPFRLKQGGTNPTGIKPGDLTKDMSRPWHYDFTLCSGGGQNEESWWPAARPDSVYSIGDATTVVDWDRSIANTPDKMVANWFRLGFMLPDPGTGDLVETDRRVVCKDAFIITDRNTFGKDEIDAMLFLANPAVIDAAFYVVVEGFLPIELGIVKHNPAPGDPQFNSAPAITPASPVDGMTFQPTALKCEDDTLNPNVAQRFTFFYQVHFTKTDAFPAEHQDYPITATIKGLSAQATLTLTMQPNPFMMDGPISWLSTDVRVFQIRPTESLPGLPMVTMGNTPDDTYAFIQNVIKALPANPSAFQNISQDETASQLELSETVNNVPVFNFALCRVRYFAKSTPALTVRVFFRLFQTAATGTNYDPNTSYRQGGHPGTKIPVLGVQGGEVVTIPCFAEKRANLVPGTSLNAQTDLTNVRDIPFDGTGHEVDEYYGCWLDINQPGQALFPIQTASPAGPFPPAQNRSIRDLVRGLHQCLVAEIAFDPDPIAVGSSTASSDKLAQRNLAIVPSANPGGPASHRVQHTFDVKPTRAAIAENEQHDELMIDWGAAPPGSIATIYVPDVKVAEVLDIAARTFNLQTLERVDDHTLHCKTGGVTYVPIPPGVTAIAGLLTVDLPPTVRKGQVFKIVVRQVTTTPVGPPQAISATMLREAIRVREERAVAAATGALVAESVTAVATPLANARRVLGAFQITVPVRTAEEMLPGEQRGLATVRAILGTIPEENRWYLPFRRYATQIADRVDALGGDSRGDVDGGGGSRDGGGGEGDRDVDRDHDERRGCVAMVLHFLLRPFRRH
jgi:L-lysine epsilon oxidase-like protein